MAETKIISIILPCRNEEKFIAKCLDSILAFTIPDIYSIEIIIIDGMSEDRTKEIILNKKENHPCIQVIENPNKFQSFALNIGIKAAKGDYILRLDAHADYPAEYLSLLLKTALSTGADNTGGLIHTKPYNDSYAAAIVQALTTHPFGVGNSGFRIGMKEGPADTVPYGFFKKEIFSKIGFFNERLIRAQDYEFNRRIIKNGGNIWFNPNIQMSYYNQPNIITFLKKQLFFEAPYNVYMWYLAPYAFAYRHAITGVFAAGIIFGALLSLFLPWFSVLYLSVLILYFCLAILSSIQQSIRYKKTAHLFTLPLCFCLYHFIHGIGILWGCLRVITKTAPIFRIKKNEML